jgi:small subunit ribosomal protein S9
MKKIQTSGRRKLAVARAVLSDGNGKVTVNGKSLDVYTPKYVKLRMQEPLILAGKDAEKVDIAVRVSGGGIAGQADATRLVIARALALYKEKLREVFLNYDRNMLVADVRYKETRKPNTHGKARAKRQKSYR